MQIGLQVKEYGLEVLGSLVLVINFLEATCLISEYANNESAINSLAATGAVLEDLLGLFQVYNGKLILALIDFGDSLIDEVDDGGGELFYFSKFLLSLLRRAWSLAVGNSTLFLKIYSSISRLVWESSNSTSSVPAFCINYILFNLF